MKYVSQRGLLTRAFSPSRRSIKLNIPQKTPYVAQRSRLREVAAPDALVKSASDLGVRVGGEDLSVTGLASVGPALGLCGADAIETGERRHLAEPAADEDVLEVVSVAGSEDLTEGARADGHSGTGARRRDRRGASHPRGGGGRRDRPLRRDLGAGAGAGVMAEYSAYSTLLEVGAGGASST